MSVRRWFRCSGVILVALGWASAAGTARAQVVTVAVRSAGDLLAQLRALARALARAADPERTRPALDALDALEGGGALKGLDRTRPLVATLDFAPNPRGGPAGPPAFTLFVPVTSQADLLETLGGAGLTVDDQPGAEGFSHKLTAVGARVPPGFVLASPPSGYAVVTTIPQGAAKLRAARPAELLPDRPGVLLAGLRIDRIPEPLKRSVLANVARSNEASARRREGETEAQHRGRRAGIAFTEEAFKVLVRDGRELSIDLDADPKRGRLSLTLGVDAKPGTATAGSFASFAARKGRFRGLPTASALSLVGVLPNSEFFREAIAAARDKAQEEKDPEKRRVSLLLLDALEPTLKGPSIDGAVLMDASAPGGDGKAEGGSTVIFTGIALEGSKKVEAAFREAIATGPKPKKRVEMAFDHDRGDDGTPVHKFTLDPAGMEKAGFGEPLLFFAFPEGAALGAVGADGLASVKTALAALRRPATPDASTPQVSLDVLAGRLAQVRMEGQEGFQEAAKEAFSGPNAGKDRIHLGLSGGPDRVRLALDVDLPVLRFFAEAGARRRKGGIGQAP